MGSVNARAIKAVSICIVSMLALGLAACSDDSSDSGDSTPVDTTSVEDDGAVTDQNGSDQQGGSGVTDYNAMNCGQLEYMARKYASIVDSAESMPDNSVIQMQALQSQQHVIKIIEVMGAKGCDNIPSL